MDNNEIIAFLLKETGLRQGAFCKQAGLAPTTFTLIKMGKIKKLSKRAVAKIVAAFPRFSEQWLLTGEGEPIVNHSAAPVAEAEPKAASQPQPDTKPAAEPQDPEQDGNYIDLREVLELMHRQNEQISILLNIIDRNS